MKIICEKEKKRKIFQTWRDIISRCENQNNSQYKNYGSRGIKVCEKWCDLTPIKIRGRNIKLGCLNFYDDMESTWFIGATIDRIDNDGNYEQSNCQWLTRSENSSKAAKKRVANKTHPFIGGEIQKQVQQERIKNGTHNFLDKNFQRKMAQERVKNGTHPFLGGEIQRKLAQERVKNGTHPFLFGIPKGRIWINNGIKEHSIFPETLQEFDSDNWKRGRLSKPGKIRGKYKKRNL